MPSAKAQLTGRERLRVLAALLGSIVFSSHGVGMDPTTPPSISYRLSGKITDVRFTTARQSVTNRISVEGQVQGGNFLVRLNPIRTEDEIEEVVGWDGHRMRLIQMYPDEPGRGQPRNELVGYVEAVAFPRYATHATVATSMALAGIDAFSVFTNRLEPIILGMERHYPEEQNHYTLHLSPGKRSVVAITPGELVSSDGQLVPIPGFRAGFERWAFSSSSVQSSGGLEISYSYRRNFIHDGSPFQYRVIQGEILLKRESPSENLTFVPPIARDGLHVRDFTPRRELFGVTHGQVDLTFEYDLTNGSWDAYDSGAMASNVAAVKLSLGKTGVAFLSPIHSSKRNTVKLLTLVVLGCSASSAVFVGCLVNRLKSKYK